VDDILTPSLVPIAFAWVVVLDYEQALGCLDLGDGKERTILVVTHGNLLEFENDSYLTGKETATRLAVYTAVENWGRFLPRVEKSLCN
jgi:hypothetical protein